MGHKNFPFCNNTIKDLNYCITVIFFCCSIVSVSKIKKMRKQERGTAKMRKQEQGTAKMRKQEQGTANKIGMKKVMFL